MVQSEQAAWLRSLELRVTDLENDRAGRSVSDCYARFYGPLAILSLVMPFVPLLSLAHRSAGEMREDFYTLLQLAGARNGDPAVFGAFLVAILATLLAVATVRTRSAMLPCGIAGTAGLIVLMLLTKPGASPATQLTAGGEAGLVLAMCIVALSLVHAVHLLVRDRRHKTGQAKGAVPG